MNADLNVNIILHRIWRKQIPILLELEIDMGSHLGAKFLGYATRGRYREEYGCKVPTSRRNKYRSDERACNSR